MTADICTALGSDPLPSTRLPPSLLSNVVPKKSEQHNTFKPIETTILTVDLIDSNPCDEETLDCLDEQQSGVSYFMVGSIKVVLGTNLVQPHICIKGSNSSWSEVSYWSYSAPWPKELLQDIHHKNFELHKVDQQLGGSSFMAALVVQGMEKPLASDSIEFDDTSLEYVGLQSDSRGYFQDEVGTEKDEFGPWTMKCSNPLYMDSTPSGFNSYSNALFEDIASQQPNTSLIHHHQPPLLIFQDNIAGGLMDENDGYQMIVEDVKSQIQHLGLTWDPLSRVITTSSNARRYELELPVVCIGLCLTAHNKYFAVNSVQIDQPAYFFQPSSVYEENCGLLWVLNNVYFDTSPTSFIDFLQNVDPTNSQQIGFFNDYIYTREERLGAQLSVNSPLYVNDEFIMEPIEGNYQWSVPHATTLWFPKKFDECVRMVFDPRQKSAFIEGERLGYYTNVDGATNYILVALSLLGKFVILPHESLHCCPDIVAKDLWRVFTSRF